MKGRMVKQVVVAVALASLALGAHATPIHSKKSGPHLGWIVSEIAKSDIRKKVQKIKLAKVSFKPTLKLPKAKKLDVQTFGIAKSEKISEQGLALYNNVQVREPAPVLVIGAALLALGMFRRKLASAA